MELMKSIFRRTQFQNWNADKQFQHAYFPGGLFCNLKNLAGHTKNFHLVQNISLCVFSSNSRYKMKKTVRLQNSCCNLSNNNQFQMVIRFIFLVTCTAQEMKFSIKDFFSKCGQIRRKLRIWSHLQKKMEKRIFFIQISYACSEIGIQSMV